LSNKRKVSVRRVAWIIAGFVFVAIVWALSVELTYERNIRRGIPADFRIFRMRTVYNWRT
jgi:hypothetical protein